MTPAQYITAIETFLSSNIGVTSIRHPDGREMRLDRKQALAELAYWQGRQDRASNGGIFNRSRFGLIGDA